MDTSISDPYQRPAENSSTTTTSLRPSPPGSSSGSPRGMIPPSNPFAVATTNSHTFTISSSSLPSGGSRSPRGYNSSSYTHSTSPSAASGGIPDVLSTDSSGFGISPTQGSTAILNTQKRAYRQRRKDPSCDSCRERKVKCDATETTSCSECSSRSQKCQFTKETNRRMSSIKQVQDLQSQIAELTQQNSHLRTRVTDQPGTEMNPRPVKVHRTENKTSPPAITKRVLAPTMSNFDHVRKNIRAHSQGIFEPPTYEHVGSPTNSLLEPLPVPPRSDFMTISQSYLESIHQTCPVIHWPTFQKDAEITYNRGDFFGKSKDWVGMFFAVLACGCLNIQGLSGSLCGATDSTRFYEIALQMISPWPQNPTTVHAQLLLLLSIFATENNMKSAGSMWLSCAIQVAQSLGLNSDSDRLPIAEAEVRRNLWWAIYVRERITSIGSNAPMMINEEDCDVPLPSSVEYRPTIRGRNDNQTPVDGFLAVIHVTRLFSGLSKTLKSSTVSQLVLQDYEERFSAKLSLFPQDFDPKSDTCLELAALYPILSLQFARFHLQRRNLSPLCTQSQRSTALSNCVLTAQNTASYISRTLQSSSIIDSDKSWDTRAAHLASNMLCIHLWRCILVLCLKGDYQSALVCLRLSTAIGDLRKINLACGSNLFFFLNRVVDYLGDLKTNMQLQTLPEHNEELLAYASGDMQSAPEHSWVWLHPVDSISSAQTSSTQFSTSPPLSHSHTKATIEATLPLRSVADASDMKSTTWHGWHQIESLIRLLIQTKKSQKSPDSVSVYYSPPHNPVKRVQVLGPTDEATNGRPVPATNAGVPNTKVASGASRISIANII